MKDYGKNKELSYLKYWDVNNLYGQAMSQRLLVNNLKRMDITSQFNEEDLIKSYNEESDEGYFFEIVVQYPEKFHELHNDLPFLPERINIEKPVNSLHDNTEYVIHTRNLKEALKRGFILKKSSQSD